MKKVERTGDPVVAQVPWGQQTGLDQAAEAFEAVGDAEPTFAPEMVAEKTEAQQKFADQVKAAFTGEPTKQASPFAPKPKAAPAPEPEVFEMGDAPAWIDLVRFCQKHGKDIIQARYPHPRGIAIDTIYRGVTVIAHPTTEVRHVTLGWIPWEDAQYE